MRSQVLRTITMKITLIWNVMPCKLAIGKNVSVQFSAFIFGTRMEAAGPPKWWFLSTKPYGTHYKCDIHIPLVSQTINFSVAIFVHACYNTVTILLTA